MRILLLPASHALSHLTKALALKEALEARGHEAILAAGKAHAPFLDRLGLPCLTVPDIQEADDGPAPAFAWFRDPGRFGEVVLAEAELMRKLRPDRTLGIFRFTTTAAAALAGVPCDTLACGCMMSSCRDTLGFRPGEPGLEAQAALLDGFHAGCAARIRPALETLGLPAPDDLRDLIAGERTFLWDTPWFQPLPEDPSRIHVGPLAWSTWPEDPEDAVPLDTLPAPLAVLSFGTALQPDCPLARIAQRLVALGFHVAVAGGGRLLPLERHPRITHFRFAPMAELLARAELLVCHGGQQTLFEALAAGVPAGILPFHSEQAQNARCMERLGAGAPLLPPTVFWGASQVYTDALRDLEDAELDRRLLALAGRRAPLADPLLRGAAARIVDRL